MTDAQQAEARWQQIGMSARAHAAADAARDEAFRQSEITARALCTIVDHQRELLRQANRGLRQYQSISHPGHFGQCTGPYDACSHNCELTRSILAQITMLEARDE